KPRRSAPKPEREAASQKRVRLSPHSGANRTRQPPPGERVSGELLATAAAPPEPNPEAQAAAARRGDPRADPGGLSVPAAAWGGLATLALLGAGALLEARGLALLLPGRRGAS
ncbi:MAG: hypothetical protein AB7P38_10515, partial [Solirubrobacterales bacterium]